MLYPPVCDLVIMAWANKVIRGDEGGGGGDKLIHCVRTGLIKTQASGGRDITILRGVTVPSQVLNLRAKAAAAAATFEDKRGSG